MNGGHSAIVKLLLDTGKVDLDSKVDGNRTPLKPRYLAPSIGCAQHGKPDCWILREEVDLELQGDEIGSSGHAIEDPDRARL